jgi:hypothetical protein
MKVERVVLNALQFFRVRQRLGDKPLHLHCVAPDWIQSTFCIARSLRARA